MTFKQKIAAIVVAAILGVFAIAAASLYMQRAAMISEREGMVRNVVGAMSSSIGALHTKASKGEITDDQAKKLASDLVNGARYNEKEYFWLQDKEGNIVTHPIKAELNGTNQLGTTDPNGVKLFAEMVDVVKKNGFGFVNYSWSKPGSATPVPKVSFVQDVGAWNWIVGSGVYIDDIDDAVASKAKTLLGATLVILVILSTISILISRIVIRQIGGDPHEAAEAMRAVQEGNLSVRIMTDTENSLLGRLNETVSSLNGSVRSITRNAQALRGQAHQISGQAHGVAEASHEQSEAASAMAAAVEELTVSINHVSDRADETRALASRAMEEACAGEDRVKEVCEAVSCMASQAEAASAKIGNMVAQASEVSSIAHTIKDIADQTNLLALNAAIEAARAGEAGRGFAVVADEVRKLSERTAEATAKIEDVLQAVEAESKASFAAMTNVTDNVRSSINVAQQAMVSLTNIENSAKEVLFNVNEVANATREQGAAANEIALQVEMVARKVEQTSAAANESSMIATDMERLAEDLADSVAKFSV